ncbi:MAG: HAD-IA family hydrolase [Candidatus Babeliales bacterium]
MKLIACDLHGVVFHVDYKKISSLLWHVSPKLPLLAAPLNPKFWIHLAKLIAKNAVGEEYVMRMAQWHPSLAPYINDGIDLINAQKPNQAVVDLLQQLKKNGYALIAFSNIGEHAYAHLSHQFPHIMNLFDDALYTTQGESYLRKPEKAAFQKLLDTTGLPPAQILFIDNKQKNITAAQQLCITTCHYTSPKKLQRQLLQHIVF